MVVNGYNPIMKTLVLEPDAASRTKGCCQPVAAPVSDKVATELSDLGKAVGDPTRVQLLHMLKAAKEPICVCDFTAAFDLGQPTISHHLAKLRDAGLVESHKQGIWAFYALSKDLTGNAQSILSAIP